MSENRARAFSTMEQILDLPVVLLSESNITAFLKWPVNSNVQYLSGIHKADYFRVYFLFHYGGYVNFSHKIVF